ncbi:MAG: alpha/beta fold hydrolase [Sandaracinus sp.]|nr:alpha/beta fold hydrolase [Sandaracinus sp.]MCB9615544.1 alpha/beta fold hydrolase [Sandaracinus sp.]MCB9624104.1 alpha/beta fold hydrolase [Sandaracinus sp.]
MARWSLLLIAFVALSGCYRMQTLRRQVAKLDRYVEVEGRVERPEGSEGPLVVELVRAARSDRAPDAIVERAVLRDAGEFRFVVRPSDRYSLVAFVDTDGDLALDAGERWTMPQAWRGEPLVLRPDDVADMPPRGLMLSRNYDLGAVVSLDDPRFGPEGGEYGIWQPLRWPQRYPMGVLFTESWDPTRVPVLFVYGIGGFGKQLRRFVEWLDHDRFQAWFVNYPTGLPIAQVAQWLRRAMDELHAQLGFERTCVVAHSMGGLVARDMLGSFEGESYVRGLTTIATPFGGIGSAAFGVSWSPAVAPAWRDLAPESTFLHEVFARPGPDAVARDLVFLFEPGESGDGVVPLQSQLRAEAQREAERRRGFPFEHAAALEAREVWTFVAEGLDRCAPSAAASAVETPVASEASPAPGEVP